MQGSCATTTANGPSPAVPCRGLDFVYPLSPGNLFEDFLSTDRASFFRVLLCGLCCLWRVWDLRSVQLCEGVQPEYWQLGCILHELYA